MLQGFERDSELIFQLSPRLAIVGCVLGSFLDGLPAVHHHLEQPVEVKAALAHCGRKIGHALGTNHLRGDQVSLRHVGILDRVHQRLKRRYGLL